MPVETAVYINGLNAAYPGGEEPAAQGDDHLRLLKAVLKATFPTLNAPLKASLVPFTPAGNIIATEVQAALVELDTEKLAVWGNAVSATAALSAKDGYFTAAAAIPRLELHKPGVVAGFWYINASNSIAWARSNGGGVASGADDLSFNSAGLVSAGNVTAYSDERVKANWRELGGCDFIASLAQVKSGIYDRTDQELTQVGVSAQSLRLVLPEAVLEGPDGMLSVAYGNAALAACVRLAQRVIALEARLEALEDK